MQNPDTALSDEKRSRLLELGDIVIAKFTAADWQTLGAYTGEMDLILGHDRLLRSLRFSDDDYAGNAHVILHQIASKGPRKLEDIERYMRKHHGPLGENISSVPNTSRTIVFSPAVFEVPDQGIEHDLISVMTPFAIEFESIFEATSAACLTAGYRALRAKDIWLNNVVVQDVFSLIYRSIAVICDFTGRNPNVFYEAGIAHTLGKTVIPITQSSSDIPFDLQHHRYLLYLNNAEGRNSLQTGLIQRLHSLPGRAVF